MLVDPWLVDRLVFAGQDWLYAGSKRVARPDTIDLEKVAAQTDFILLTQVCWGGVGCCCFFFTNYFFGGGAGVLGRESLYNSCCGAESLLFGWFGRG